MEIEGPLLRFQTKLVFFAKPAAACRIEGTFQCPEHSRRTAVVVFHGEESHTLCELSWNIRISITDLWMGESSTLPGCHRTAREPDGQAQLPEMPTAGHPS